MELTIKVCPASPHPSDSLHLSASSGHSPHLGSITLQPPAGPGDSALTVPSRGVLAQRFLGNLSFS
jgi:hypothetical protein